MNKLSLYITSITIATILLMSACGNTESGDTSAGNAEDGISLKLNLTEGNEFTQALNLKFDSKMTMPEKEPMDQTMENNTIISHKVLSTGDSTEVQMTFDRMQMTMGMGEQVMQLDTETDSVDARLKPANDIFKGLIGQPLVITFLPNADAVGIEGYEQIMQNIAETQGVDPTQLQGFTQNMNQSVSTYAATLPEGTVKPGDSWSNEVSQDMQGYPVNATNTYTLKEIKDEVAIVELDGVFDIDTTGMGEAGLAPENMKLSGTQTGTLEVDRVTGWTNSADLQQVIDLNLSMMGQSMDVKLTGTITIREKDMATE